MISTLLTIFIVLCIIGLILWGINQIPGIPPIVKVVLYVIIGVILLLWCLSMVNGGGIHLSSPNLR
jgi:preprotein translocase subunit SecE